MFTYTDGVFLFIKCWFNNKKDSASLYYLMLELLYAPLHPHEPCRGSVGWLGGVLSVDEGRSLLELTGLSWQAAVASLPQIILEIYLNINI